MPITSPPAPLPWAAVRDRGVLAVGLGEVLYDVFPDETCLGGAPVNFARHFRQCGLPAAVVSAVGRDALGDRAAELLADAGVEATLTRVPYPTGTVRARPRADGATDYVFAADTAYDHLQCTPAWQSCAARAGVICFGTLAQRSPAGRAAVAAFLAALTPPVIRIFDLNLRGDFYTRDLITAGLAACDICKVNDDELPILAALLDAPPQAAAVFAALSRRYGMTGFICTAGADGSEIFMGTQRSRAPSPPVAVVDTVGAGDAFTAVLIAALICDRPLPRAHALAARAAAFVCSRRGAVPPLPEDLRREITCPSPR